MAITQTQIDALKDAIAEGTLRVRFGDREVYYDGFPQMRQRLRFMQDELNASSGTVKPPRRRTVFMPGKGY